MADGPLIAAVDAAALMLRDCYWWRRLANPDSPWDDATAAAHIHIDALPAPDNGAADHSLAQLEALRPFALLWADVTDPLRTQSDVGGNAISMISGRMVMQIEIPVPPDLADDPSALGRAMYTNFGRIILGDSGQPGLWQLSGQPGYLPLIDVKLLGIIRSNQKDAVELGDFVTAEFTLAWGQSV